MCRRCCLPPLASPPVPGRSLESELSTGKAESTDFLPAPSPSLPLTHSATVGCHRQGQAEGEPCSEIAESHCQQETREAAFWSCRGRPVGVLSTKGTRRERREEQSEGGKMFKIQKMEKAPSSQARAQSPSVPCGWEQVAVEE